MKVLGLIVEYNPFHNGHLHHLKYSKSITECSHTVAIMSGNFLQRGEPALFDKWTRAEIAVKNGVDLVIELPFVYSCQSAEIFSYGAIKILNSLNIIDSIAFGCENNDIDNLMVVANLLSNETEEFSEKLKYYLDKGLSFPKARQKAIEDILDVDNTIISSPNNILAIEYLKWLIKLNSNIKPYPINRINTGYHSTTVVNNFASATHIRNVLFNTNKSSNIKDLVPDESYEIICDYMKNKKINHINNYFEIIKAFLISMSKIQLTEFHDVNEGLENRIKNSLANSNSIDELVDNILSKRYTSTRIKRILCNMLINNNKNSLNNYFNNDYNPFIRILAFNEKGKDILKKIKEQDNDDINIITNLSQNYKNLTDDQKKCLEIDITATNMYYLITNNKKYNLDYIKNPVII